MEQESKEKERMEKERSSFTTTSTSTTSNEAETGILATKSLEENRLISQYGIIWLSSRLSLSLVLSSYRAKLVYF